MNTWILKAIIKTLLNGGYMRRCISHAGKEMYKLYNKAGIIEEQFRSRKVKAIEDKLPVQVFSKDKHGRITLIRSGLQQLHGNSRIKKFYKEHLKQNRLCRITKKAAL